VAPCSSTLNRFIQSATLNGRPYQRPWIAHQDILSGGSLVLTMGPVPNKHWGAGPGDAPPSQTTGQPDMHIGVPRIGAGTTSAQATAPTVPAGTPTEWTCQVTNNGTAAGSIPLTLRVDGQPYATKTILLNVGDSAQVSIPVTLYSAGLHTITLGKTGFPQRLTIQARPPALLFSDLSIPLPPVLQRTDSFSVSARVKNIGSTATTASVTLFVDHHPIQTKRVAIGPGQEKQIRFTLAGANCPPLSMIGIGDLAPLTVRILDPNSTPALDTSLLQQLGAIFYTGIGHGTPDTDNIIIHGTPKWVPGLFGKAVQLDAPHGTWIEPMPGKALDSLAHSDSMTMMCWIYPMDEENFSDIFCCGDWATLQLKASNTMVNFYTGGWEGHEAFAPVPAGWNRHWHHIAGVTRAPYEELYIDGRLAAVKRMEQRDPNGETGLSDYSNHPWSIGRNENDPTRIFKGYIGEPMLFRKALTPEEINRVMMHLDAR
jgi:hypothetical protein